MSASNIEAKDSDFWILCELSLRPTPVRPKDPCLIRWLPPHPGWIKINVDGACKYQGPKAGAGFVVTSSESRLIAAAAIPTVDIGINHIELIGAWSALIWAYNKFGPCYLWIEGDSKVVVDYLRKPPHPSDDPTLADCKCFIGKMRKVMVSHIYQEGNAGADLWRTWGALPTHSLYGKTTSLLNSSI